MSPTEARRLLPGAGFLYVGLRYTLATIYEGLDGRVWLVPEGRDAMFPAAQCDPVRRTPMGQK